MPPSPSFYAVIAGAGPGTGYAIARRFARYYPVVLMARSQSTLDELAASIASEPSSHATFAVAADMSDPDSVKAGFDKVKDKFSGFQGCAAAIFNLSARPHPKPFLEENLKEWEAGFAASGRGSFLFSQAVLPLLLDATKSNPTLPPTLIFTGATASLKSSARFSSFSVPKFALRALSQSLAKEFGPQGVHVVHAVIDGLINIAQPREGMSEEMMKRSKEMEGKKIEPSEIAEAYWNVHSQGKSAWTWELDLRPYGESW